MKPSNDYDIQKLVSELKKGDQKSFKKLYLIFGKKLYYFALKFRIPPDECEEVAQEVFLRIWDKRAELDPDLSFSAYVIRIARNLIFNKFRKQVYEKAYLSFLASDDSSHNETEKDVLFADLKQIASRAIEQLPDKRRHIFKMSRESGLSNQEIAENLNISKSTVENQLNKALKFLKEYLRRNADIGLRGNP